MSKFERIFTIVAKIICALLIFIFLKECLGLFYWHTTRLSPEDLEWVKPPSKYSSYSFLSDSGHVSRIELDGYDEANRPPVFFISSAGGDSYESNAWVSFSVKDSLRTLEGSLGICRLVDCDTLCVRSSMGAFFFDDFTPINIRSVKIKDRVFDDCLVFDSITNGNSPYWKDRPQLFLEEYILSKKYGLLYYKLKNGEGFYRIFDKEN